MLRCLIVEDQLMFLELLQRLLESQRGLEVIATAATRDQAVAACRLHRPDLVILDLGLADGDGLPVLEALGQWCPQSRAVVLSAQAAGETTTARAPRAAARAGRRIGLGCLSAG